MLQFEYMSSTQSESDHWTISFEEFIRSDAVDGKRCIDKLLAKLEGTQWIDEDIFDIHLAFEEAIVNAIKHGNRNDRSKKVHIVYKLSPSKIRLEVTDEGDGFNVDDVPDPTDEVNLEVPSGRGLHLMRSFMSLVQFNDKGNGVVMEKYCSSNE